MNKQEAIEKIKNLKGITILDKTINFDSEMISKKEVLNIAKQLDEPVKPPEQKPLEPKKPVVPQYVADFYESIEDDFEDGVYCLFIQFYEEESELSDELYWWFKHEDNKPIETLVKMKLYGYDVEKEKLYRVELPNPNGDSNRYGLCKVDGRIVIGCFIFGINKAVNTKLTEAEIKKDFEWAWQFAEEVKNDDTKI